MGLIPGGLLELPIGQEISYIEGRVGRARAVEIHHGKPVGRNPDVFSFEVTVCEGCWFLGQAVVQFPHTVEQSLNRRSDMRQKNRDRIAFPHNRPNLCRKIMGLRSASERHGEAMQSAERCPGTAQPPRAVQVKAPRVGG